MTYIYDILLNFNEEYYEFYDWNKDDKIIHIKRIPIYRIDEKDIKNIIYSSIVFDSKFLEMIKDKTEVFLKHETKSMKYSCLLCANEKLVAINLNEHGKVIGKSDLLIDEYNEIINVSDNFNYIEINYVIEENNNINLFKTRKTKEKNKFITNELKHFTLEELQYIYYDLYTKCENDIDIILKELY